MTSSVATTLGCTGGDLACLCTKPEFGYGVRDCSNESCPAGTDTSGGVSYVSSQCAGGKCLKDCGIKEPAVY